MSLGLPDSLLGAAWPVMQVELGVPSSYAGYVYMTISIMTILSALLSTVLIRRFETRKIVLFSIFLTVIGMLGFSAAEKYYQLILIAIPYGLGAGAIDAAVNHYVANHYSGSIMNFLHCFYGAGAVISPNLMALAIKRANWNAGYRWTSFIQMGIMLVCFLSQPLWKKSRDEQSDHPLETAGIPETIRVPGVLYTMIAFFSYCSAESTCYLWTSSYFAGTRPQMNASTVASFGGLVFFGLMVGRVISGIISNKLGDKKLIRCGIIVEIIGILLLMIPGIHYFLAAGAFVVIGMGMGPVFPGIEHMAPANFGKKYSAAVIGMQMAAAYMGSSFMPMVFGQIQRVIGIGIMPVYLLFFAMATMAFLEISYKSLKMRRLP
jgi:fucose permease